MDVLLVHFQSHAPSLHTPVLPVTMYVLGMAIHLSLNARAHGRRLPLPVVFFVFFSRFLIFLCTVVNNVPRGQQHPRFSFFHSCPNTQQPERAEAQREAVGERRKLRGEPGGRGAPRGGGRGVLRDLRGPEAGQPGPQGAARGDQAGARESR